MAGISGRLQRLLIEQGLNQTELARKVGVTPSAISSILSGRRIPSQDLLGAMSAALGVTADWLARGGTRKGTAEPMRDAALEISWHERETYGDGTRQFGNARIEVFQPTLPVFARETGQNSNDAATGNADALIEYRLGILSGARLEQFLDSLQWPVLKVHYAAVAEDEQHRTTRRYREGLAALQKTQKLWVMRVDDYGTTGLGGDDFGPGPFSALVRNSQDSYKHDVTAGGRFGLGSSVLSAVSAFDLVLFTSVLSSPVDGRTEGRLIGRTYLPWHSLGNGKDYEGPFYLGKRDPLNDRRRLSHWAQPQLLDDLWLTRETQVDRSNTGTSALIVGFFDPESGVGTEQAPDSVITRLSDAFIEAFWPAIAHNRLSAIFSQYENDVQVYERRVNEQNLAHPCASLFKLNDSILSRDVSLRIPKSRESGHGPFDHSARLLVELIDSDSDDRHVNEVAMWRKPEMVVRYKPYPHLALGARPFRAALICGEAIESIGLPITPADLAAEVFLAKAEPPQHDSWTADGTDIIAEYWGGKTNLKAFEDSLRDALRELTRPPEHGEPEGPQQLRELLSLPTSVGVVQRRAYVAKFAWLDDSFEALSATIRLSVRTDAGKVALRPMLTLATEGGGGIPVPAQITPVQGVDHRNDGLLIPHQQVRDIIIVVRPQWSEVPVRPDLTALTLEVGIQEFGD